MSCVTSCVKKHILYHPSLSPGEFSLNGEILSHPKQLILPHKKVHKHENIQHMCWKILKRLGNHVSRKAWTLGLGSANGFDFPNTAWKFPTPICKHCNLCGQSHNLSVYGYIAQCHSTSASVAKSAFVCLHSKKVQSLLTTWIATAPWQESLVLFRLLLHTSFVKYCLENTLTFTELAASYRKACQEFQECVVENTYCSVGVNPSPQTRIH